MDFKNSISKSESGTALAIKLREQETAVLRITITDELKEQRWILQGRLSGPWVAQLKSNWKQSHDSNGDRKCVVDVSGVTFVDLDGERVLAVMMRDGAKFIATGVYTKHLLETIEKRRQRWIRTLMGCF
jgi:anti-anti-sigma regulatory factor